MTGIEIWKDKSLRVDQTDPRVPAHGRTSRQASASGVVSADWDREDLQTRAKLHVADDKVGAILLGWWRESLPKIP